MPYTGIGQIAGFYLPGFLAKGIMNRMTKQPFNDDQRQQFLDSLPDDQVSPNAEQTFNVAIARAAQPKQSKPETPEQPDDYTDTRTHSDTTGDISDSRSDTSHP